MPVPNGQESEFSVEELFFSITDPRGIIIAGNDVFVRVSKYDRADLVGKPHNLVRHPDMPKAVFNLLWTEIKAGRPIGAYVKNMSKDGSYYWVFACVYLIPDGYLSIRLKPSSKIFEAIPDLYQKALKVEKEKGMEAGLAFIVDAIKGLGFKSYQSFMARALSEEIKSRRNLMNGMSQSEFASGELANNDELKKTLGRGKYVQNKFESMSGQLFDALTRIDTLKNRTASLPKEFLNLHYLGINLLATIERMGQDGRTLGQIVSGITQLGGELKEELVGVNQSIENVLREVERAEFLLQSANFQADMVGNFVIETLNYIATHGEADDLTKRKLQNCSILFSIIFDAIPEMNRLVTHFGSVVSSCERSIGNFYKLSSGMEFIRLSSKVETARLSNEVGAIDHFNVTLGSLIKKIKTELSQMQLAAQGANQAINEIQSLLHSVNSSRSEVVRQRSA